MQLNVSDEQRQRMMDRAARYEADRPTISLKFGAFDLTMDNSTRLCAWRVLEYFTKEPETISWLNTLRADDVLFDVGANMGLYSVWAAAARSARVIAFEPEASNYATLMVNLRENRLTDKVQAFCIGISDKIGLGPMEVRWGPAGQSGHQVQVVDSKPCHAAGPTSLQGVSTYPLDHLIYEQGLPCPTHLKVDVDGIEHAVVAGAKRLLADPRLRSIMIELMLENNFQGPVIDTLVAAGFRKDAAMERAVREKTTGTQYTGNILFTRH